MEAREAVQRVPGAGTDGRRRPLTRRQREVLDFIGGSTRRSGRPPTLREIGEQLGIASTNGVRDHLQALIDKGYLTRDERSARGLRLLTAHGTSLTRATAAHTVRRAATGSARGVVHVPVLGRVAAGQPVLAEQNVEHYLSIDRSVVRDGDVFALRVQGDSMRDAGIMDGDYVFVRQQATAQPRDIVVALIGEETTVKRFVPAGESIRLEPENPAYQPLVFSRKDPGLTILGKVSAVLRTIR
jgi:repressor LexA